MKRFLFDAYRDVHSTERAETYIWAESKEEAIERYEQMRDDEEIDFYESKSYVIDSDYSVIELPGENLPEK